jgi:glycerol-3-phosphate dehydrogenase
MSVANDYDVIVIGGGINGAAIARESALAGYRVALFERGDLGGGTTAASTRLIHGGLRYLEHAEIRLVRESLHERERLLRLAPHLVTPLTMVLPVYAGGRRPRWQIRTGMWVYDLLSIGKSLPRYRSLDRKALGAALPGLATDGLLGGVCYYDAQIRFPERLVVENVRDAVVHGAAIHTYAPVTRILVDAGRARGVEWRQRDGRSGRALGACIVNAAGPWVDRVLGQALSPGLIGGTKGSHIVCRPFPGAPDRAVYAEADDGRPFFVVPWNGLYLIGTTDERFAGEPGAVAISPHEYRYLLGATKRLFPAAARLADHVAYTQAGVRPLPRAVTGATGAITRDHVIHAHRDAAGLFSVVGGKLTTHRALAEDVLGEVARHVGGSARSLTRARPLPGALDAAARIDLEARLDAALGAAQSERLIGIYGTQAATIADLAQSSRELAMVAGPGGATLVAELVHALQNEWAMTLGDILLRRCMAGLAADRGRAVAGAAAQWLVRLGIWDRARGERETADYARAVRRFAVPVATD